MARTPLMFLPWRSQARRAVDGGKPGTSPAIGWLCIFASPAADDGGETFADGGHSGRAEFIHIFFVTNPHARQPRDAVPVAALRSFAGARSRSGVERAYGHPGRVSMATAPLVLASASEARARILRHAGVAFVGDPASLDEAAIKAAQRAQGSSPEDVAIMLAETKALEVAGRHPGSLVLGADQLLVCGSRWFDKPETRAGARATLEALRGRTHRLISGMAVARDGAVRWRHVEVATLTMRRYSDRFIDWYLREAEEESLRVVGACRLEGFGAQALDRVEGDYFAILGLPLLPLLEFLRREGMVLA